MVGCSQSFSLWKGEDVLLSRVHSIVERFKGSRQSPGMHCGFFSSQDRSTHDHVAVSEAEGSCGDLGGFTLGVLCSVSPRFLQSGHMRVGRCMGYCTLRSPFKGNGQPNLSYLESCACGVSWPKPPLPLRVWQREKDLDYAWTYSI